MLTNLHLHGRERDRLFVLARVRRMSVHELATMLLRAALQAPWPPAEPSAPWPAGQRVRFQKTEAKR